MVFADGLDQPFYRLHLALGPGVRRPHGTGLGLAISKQFCEMLGGDILVKSTHGQGSVFTISLPELESTDILSLEKRSPVAIAI